MLQRIWDFTKRHQRGLLIFAGTIGGIYATTYYVRSKISEYKRKSTEDYVIRENLKRRFEQNQSDCLFTIMSLLPSLAEQLTQAIDVDALTTRLKQQRQQQITVNSTESSFIQVEGNQQDSNGNSLENSHPSKEELESNMNGSVEETSLNTSTSSPPPPPIDLAQERKLKLEIWQEIKQASFARTMSSIYLLTLLSILVHVQLNLIGRYIYVASVAEMGVEASERSEASVRVRIHRKLSPDIERQYLSFSWWLIHQSWRTCVDKVQEAVREVLGDISLKKKCQYQDVCDLFDQIRTKVEVGSDTSPSLNQQLRNILIPDHDDQVLYVLRESGNDVDHIDPTLRELLDETRDFFDNPDIMTVFEHCLDRLFSLLYHRLRDPHFPEQTSAIQEITGDEGVPLVKLLPVISQKAQTILHGYPNEYLEAISDVKSLRAYSAIVYSTFDQTTSSAST